MKFPKPQMFVPKNPQKWINANNIIARSNLEKRFFKFFDTNESIIMVASEEMFVSYVSPVDNKIHRYFVDVVYKTKDGRKFMAEIKPDSQTREPNRPKTQKGNKSYLNESLTYMINDAKWKAAEKFCKDNGMIFVKLTEKNLPKALV